MGKWPLASMCASTKTFSTPWAKINFEVAFDPSPLQPENMGEGKPFTYHEYMQMLLQKNMKNYFSSL